MAHRKLIPLALAAALGMAACQDIQPDAITALAPLGITATLSEVATPDQMVLRTDALHLTGQASDLSFPDGGRRAINPGDYVCQASTPIGDWFDAQFGRVVEQEFNIIFPLVVNLAADQIPMLDALYFQTEDTPQYFGYNGEYTKVLQKTHRDTKRFWDIRSDDIQLIGMHGSMLLDQARVATVYENLFTSGGRPIPPSLAAALALQVHDLVQRSRTLNGGNHPLFSFNAFAITTYGEFIPDKIVMGDGILDGYKQLGFGDVAPQAIYAHEFGHHIQFENGYEAISDGFPGGAPEQTRYTELMADAYSAYFLTHKRGGAMNKHRVAEFLEVFFQIGDCGFASSGHHGTQNQRMAAARFGFDVADQAQKQGHILTAEQFHALFVAKYPVLVAPDAY